MRIPFSYLLFSMLDIRFVPQGPGPDSCWQTGTKTFSVLVQSLNVVHKNRTQTVVRVLIINSKYAFRYPRLDSCVIRRVSWICIIINCTLLLVSWKTIQIKRKFILAPLALSIFKWPINATGFHPTTSMNRTATKSVSLSTMECPHFRCVDMQNTKILAFVIFFVLAVVHIFIFLRIWRFHEPLVIKIDARNAANKSFV